MGEIPIPVMAQPSYLSYSPTDFTSPIGNTFFMDAFSAGVSTSLTASLCFYMPLLVFFPVTFTKFRFSNGISPAGNFDCGIYTEAGAAIVRLGSTAQAGSFATQDGDITDTAVDPGFYYAAFVQDGSGGQISTWTIGSNDADRIAFCGLKVQASTFPLPSTATFTDYSTGNIPQFGMITTP